MKERLKEIAKSSIVYYQKYSQKYRTFPSFEILVIYISVEEFKKIYYIASSNMKIHVSYGCIGGLVNFWTFLTKLIWNLELTTPLLSVPME